MYGFRFGEIEEEYDGIRYLRHEPEYIKLEKIRDENSKLIIFGGKIISLKLRPDRISYSIRSDLIPHSVPDDFLEYSDRLKSGLPRLCLIRLISIA